MEKISVSNFEDIKNYYEIKNFIKTKYDKIMLTDNFKKLISLISEVSSYKSMKVKDCEIMKINKSSEVVFKIEGNLIIENKKIDNFHIKNSFLSVKNFNKKFYKLLLYLNHEFLDKQNNSKNPKNPKHINYLFIFFGYNSLYPKINLNRFSIKIIYKNKRYFMVENLVKKIITTTDPKCENLFLLKKILTNIYNINITANVKINSLKFEKLENEIMSFKEIIRIFDIYNNDRIMLKIKKMSIYDSSVIYDLTPDKETTENNNKKLEKYVKKEEDSDDEICDNDEIEGIKREIINNFIKLGAIEIT